MAKEWIEILGTTYKVVYENEEDNPKLKECNGLCEQYSKKIVISDLKEAKEDVMCVEKPEKFQKKILRHEIIHAFLGESGLRSQSDWAECEEMIDWFAIQHEKLHQAFKEAGALENE